MAVTVRGATSSLDVARIRADFPILSQKVHGDKPVAYLDNAATSQKPRQVIDAMREVFESYNANIHRGVYEFSEKTTAAFEGAREKTARLINAEAREIIFVRNATEGVNLVAYTWGRENIKAGDRIISTVLEHHSNFVPWQQLAKDVGAEIVMIDVDDEGRLRRDQFTAALAKGRVKLVAITSTSNGLGTVTPAKELTAEAKVAGATVLIDAAQAVPHTTVDVKDIGCDFLVFSGHKMLAPPGSGAVWAHAALLERMRPFLFGGDMIAKVTVAETTWNDLPWKFEAGTSSYVDAIGLGAAIEYLEGVGLDKIHEHELFLTGYLLPRLADIPGVTMYGPKTLDDRVGVVSFNIEGIHPHDVATIFDSEGVCIRAGHHCNQLLMAKLSVAATNRASFYLYNTTEECDLLVSAILKAKKVFGV
jgi:cysteine desulfurase/selenocysteine lyase